MNLQKWIPGIQVIRDYQKEWFQNDLMAGLSITAVALPIAIAYAQLAGFPPVIGIYSCIFPPLAYALFGTSKQLVVNPDAAACTIIATAITPLAGGDIHHYLDLSIVLSFLTGIICITGGLIGLGIIADFLSKPILTGYLNGIALSIFASQIGTLLGFKIPSAGFFRTVYYAAIQVKDTHLLTLCIGVSLFILLLLFKKFLPGLPNSLAVAIAACLLVYFFKLENNGVAVVGSIPAGFPSPKIPSINFKELQTLITSALGIALVSFCSMMTTARSFAARRGYSINANQDMIALGISDIVSGFSRGFAVSGADSRTAVADSSGGKTQIATVIAAIAMSLILLFLTQPMAYIPKVALSSILIFSSINLFDFKSMGYYHSVSKIEFRISLITMLGVMTVGVLQGVLVAVALTLFKLLQFTSKPHDAILGAMKDKPGIYDSIQKENVNVIPGLLIYRFDSSLVFFNADRFREKIRALVSSENSKIKWIIIDAEAIPILDITGSQMLKELYEELKKQDIQLAITRPKAFFKLMISRSSLEKMIGQEYIFSRIHDAVSAFQFQNTK